MFYIYTEMEATTLSYSNGALKINAKGNSVVIAKTSDETIDGYLKSNFKEDKVLDKKLKRECIYIKGKKVVIDPKTKELTLVEKGEKVVGSSQAVIITVVGDTAVIPKMDDKNMLNVITTNFDAAKLSISETFIRWANWSMFKTPVLVKLVSMDNLYKAFKLTTTSLKNFNCNTLLMATDQEVADSKNVEREVAPKTKQGGYKDDKKKPFNNNFKKGGFSKPSGGTSHYVPKVSIDDTIDKFNKKYGTDNAGSNRSKKNGGKNQKQGKRK